jgi:hypothetical protein
MGLQVIQDGSGKNIGVFVPIKDWNKITQKHQDLKKLVNIDPPLKMKLSELVGKISKETGQEMLKQLEIDREEWDERLKSQFK